MTFCVYNVLAAGATGVGRCCAFSLTQPTAALCSAANRRTGKILGGNAHRRTAQPYFLASHCSLVHFLFPSFWAEEKRGL